MTPTLLAVKFFVPKPRSILTNRTRLLERFTAGLARPVTLISAPAGFGKSTLLSAWIDGQTSSATLPKRFDVLGWLSLDNADDSPARFWTYTIAAIQTGFAAATSPTAPEIVPVLEELLAVLQSDPPPALQPILDRLINAILGCGRQILLVLDDYHVIGSQQIQEQMAYLIEHQPDNLRLVLSTRADPPLPLSRLRARGQLSEFRLADLRFSWPEISQFFKAMLGLDLSAEEIQGIEASTEGWIAGLQMAALALQAQLAGQYGEGEAIQEKVRKFITTFSGKNVYILDYLADEVFNRQTDEVQGFLLKTSLLDRFCADLCDAILPVDPASPTQPGMDGCEGDSAFILSYLEKSNLFLIPLDSERTWFRYHHLFADLLRARLALTWPNLKPALYKRVSEWYERRGSSEEAIQYALAAQDWERAARLLEQHIQTFLERGYLARVIEWSARLPKEVAACRPRLSIQQTWVMGFAQRYKEFATWLENSTRLIQPLGVSLPACPPVEEEDIVGLKLNLSLMTAYHQIMLGSPARSLSILEECYRDLPAGYLWEESWICWMIGYAARSTGDLDRAAASLREAIRVCEQGENLWNDMICYTDLAMVSHLRGELGWARDLYLKALELGKLRHAEQHGYLNRVEGGLCAVLLDLNEVDAAIHHGEKGLELALGWPSANSRVLIFTSLGRARLARGDLVGAAELIQLADQERRKFPLLPINDAFVESSLVRVWLAQGELSAARQWANSLRESRGTDFSRGMLASENLEVLLVALSRILIAGGEYDQAIALLEALGESAERSKRIQALIEIDVLQAVARAHQAANPADPAGLSALESGLVLAQAGGAVRVFLDEGPVLAEMLSALRARFDPGRHHAYSLEFLDGLLALFPHTEPAPSGAPDQTGLPEPLTERETEVLHLMALGLSNREMAGRLVLSEGTIKSHVHNLIGKLGAQSRTHALALAKEFKLL